MNRFIIEFNVEDIAKSLCDQHIVKMPLEEAQMLCTTLWHHAPEYAEKHDLYKPVHQKHPCTLWAMQTRANYRYAYDLYSAMLVEYTHRYGKIHSTNALLNEVLSNAPENIKLEGWREPPPAMQHYPQCIVQGDSIQSYKNYYNEAKAYFAKWSKREQPEWFVGSMT